MLSFVLLSLAVWRLTALLVYDEGPRGVFVRLRELSDAYGGPLTCFWCASVWVGFLASLLFRLQAGGLQWALWGLALSGAAIVIDELLVRDAQV